MSSEESNGYTILSKLQVRFMMGMMTLLLVLVAWAVNSGTQAVSAGVEAKAKAVEVENLLAVHEASQNGSFEKIESQLNTLRTYHSTMRGDFKEQRLDFKDMRKILDELLNELRRESNHNHRSTE